MIESFRGLLRCPWAVLAFGGCALAAIGFDRHRLDAHSMEVTRAIEEEETLRQMERDVRALQQKILADRTLVRRTEEYLASDLLLLRGLATLWTTRPDGLWVESWSWRTSYAYGTLAYELRVEGQVRRVPMERAAGVWDAWAASISSRGVWKVHLSALAPISWTPGAAPDMLCFVAQIRLTDEAR